VALRTSFAWQNLASKISFFFLFFFRYRVAAFLTLDCVLQEKAKKLRKIARLAAQGISKGGGRKHKKRPASEGGDADAGNDDE
jgi:hypothetical protein